MLNRVSIRNLSVAESLKILGVKAGISKAQLKEAYLLAAKKHHPDTASGSEEMFKKLSEAYSKLKAMPIQSNDINEEPTMTWRNYTSQTFVRPRPTYKAPHTLTPEYSRERTAPKWYLFEGFVYSVGAFFMLSICYFKLTSDNSLKEFFEARTELAVEVEEASLANKDFREKRFIKY